MVDNMLIALIDYRSKKRVLKERKRMSSEPYDFEFKHSIVYKLRDRKAK